MNQHNYKTVHRDDDLSGKGRESEIFKEKERISLEKKMSSIEKNETVVSIRRQMVINCKTSDSTQKGGAI